MNKVATFAIVLSFALIVVAYSQEKQPIHPETAQERASGSPKEREKESETRGIEPSRPSPPTESLEFTISKQVDEVNLILSITDSKGRFVSNLTADDLKLLDNHKSPEKWNYFQSRTNLPLHVILAIDVSSSIRSRLHFEQQAASTFLKHILRKESDKAATIAFGSTVQEKTAGMTSDTGALDATIRTLQAYGETAMYDAIILASHKLHESRQNTGVRPVIILITDGDDTASTATLSAAVEAALRSEATIFALDANSIYEKKPKGRPILEKLTYETGGYILSARQDEDLKGAFNMIEKILRNQYALGYPPPDLQTNGSYRVIEVTAPKRDLRIHARKGYYAPTN